MIDNEEVRAIFLYLVKYSGHHRAAEAIKEKLFEIDPSAKTLDVETINFIFPKLSKFIYGTYLRLIKKTSLIYDFLWDNQKLYKATTSLKNIINRINRHKFEVLFYKFRPQVAVCTQAFPCGIISKLKKDYLPKLKLIAVVTDYDVHSYWIYQNVDFYTVATEKMRKKLSQKGVNSNKIKVTGIPIESKFNYDKDKQKLIQKLNLDNQIPSILIMGGSYGMGPLIEMVKILDKIDRTFQFLVVCGQNKKLEKILRLSKSQFRKTLHVFGYIDNIDELMTVSSLLITKPGGITITEALAKRVPMIIFNSIKGQESRNYHFLIDKQAAFECRNLKELANKVTVLMDNLRETNKQMWNLKQLMNPDASKDIAKLILKSI